VGIGKDMRLLVFRAEECSGTVSCSFLRAFSAARRVRKEGVSAVGIEFERAVVVVGVIVGSGSGEIGNGSSRGISFAGVATRWSVERARRV